MLNNVMLAFFSHWQSGIASDLWVNCQGYRTRLGSAMASDGLTRFMQPMGPISARERAFPWSHDWTLGPSAPATGTISNHFKSQLVWTVTTTSKWTCRIHKIPACAAAWQGLLGCCCQERPSGSPAAHDSSPRPSLLHPTPCPIPRNPFRFCLKKLGLMNCALGVGVGSLS